MTFKMAESIVLKAADLPPYYNAVDILERNLAERADKLANRGAEELKG